MQAATHAAHFLDTSCLPTCSVSSKSGQRLAWLTCVRLFRLFVSVCPVPHMHLLSHPLCVCFLVPLQLQKAHERVWESFQSLDAAWTSRVQRQQWLQLPAEAVERVLNNKALTAASENVVYIVVASWMVTQLK